MGEAASAKRIERAAWRPAPEVASGRIEGVELGTAATLLFYASEADGDGVPRHVHAYDEVFVLREGRLRFTAGAEVIEAGAGDVLLCPAGLPHAFERIGPGRAESLNIHLSERFAWAPEGAVRPAPGAAARRVPMADWASRAGWNGKVEGRDLGAEVTLLFLETDEIGAGPPLHVHDYDEIFVIRQGRARFTVGEESFEVEAGDVVFGPAHVPHRFRSLGPGRFETTDIHLSPSFEQTNLE